MEDKNFEEGDLILCTVEKVIGTTVFVKIDGNGDGTIVTSEIAPGRIRNIRDYVVPNKKIVCKVLKVDKGNISLSLRRVTIKEKKEVMDKHNQEKSALSILKSVLKEKGEETIEKIKEKKSLYDFLQACKTNPKELEQYTTKEEAGKICKILAEKKEKEKEIKKEFILANRSPNGIKIIKSILSLCQGKCKIIYIAAGKYAIKIISNNYKQANQEVDKILQDIEQEAKKYKAEFNLIKK